MHIHGSQSNPYPVNPYLAASERAIAAQRAATTRKKLLKSAFGSESPCSPTEAFNLGSLIDTQPLPGRSGVGTVYGRDK